MFSGSPEEAGSTRCWRHWELGAGVVRGQRRSSRDENDGVALTWSRSKSQGFQKGESQLTKEVINMQGVCADCKRLGSMRASPSRS